MADNDGWARATRRSDVAAQWPTIGTGEGKRTSSGGRQGCNLLLYTSATLPPPAAIQSSDTGLPGSGVPTLKTDAITAAMDAETADVALAQSGDGRAFERLYRTHVPRIHGLVRRMISGGDPDDVTQDVFVRVWEKLHTFRGESAFGTWLHRLAVNVVLMKLRKKTLPATSLDEVMDPDDEGSGPKMEIGGPDPSLAGSIDRVNLERAVEQLPPGYRQVFLLHDVQGFEHNEIASLMECSIGNSKSQLHKARTRLREILHDLVRDQARKTRIDEREATVDQERD